MNPQECWRRATGGQHVRIFANDVHFQARITSYWRSPLLLFKLVCISAIVILMMTEYAVVILRPCLWGPTITPKLTQAYGST